MCSLESSSFIHSCIGGMVFKWQPGIMAGKHMIAFIHVTLEIQSFIYICWINVTLPELAQSSDVFTCAIKRNSSMQEEKGKTAFVMIKLKAFISVQLKLHLRIAWWVVCAAFSFVCLVRCLIFRRIHGRCGTYVLGYRLPEPLVFLFLGP